MCMDWFAVHNGILLVFVLAEALSLTCLQQNKFLKCSCASFILKMLIVGLLMLFPLLFGCMNFHLSIFSLYQDGCDFVCRRPDHPTSSYKVDLCFVLFSGAKMPPFKYACY